ncbi:MAG: hypothetical protein ACRCVT_06790 [Leadbetterella sp.]
MENQEYNQSGNSALKVGLVLLLAALGLVGYLFYDVQQKNDQLQSMLNGKVTEIATAKSKIDSISNALDAKILEVQKLGGDIAELEKMKARLEEDKRSLRNSNNFSAKKYEDKIKEYEAFLAEKDAEIVKLKEENGILVTENQTLQTEKQAFITENTGLKASKDSLHTVVSDVNNENKELKKKVTIGSALKAVNVKVTALTGRGKEKTGEVKNRKIDQLKVTFILPSNELTEANNKDIFLRITDPQGAVLNDMARGGVLNYNNQEIGYSTKEIVPYKNNDQTVDILYKKDQALKSGVYNVELYAEGFKIGNATFAVK